MKENQLLAAPSLLTDFPKTSIAQPLLNALGEDVKKIGSVALAVVVGISTVETSFAQVNFGSIMGGALGSAIGSSSGAGGALVGGIVGVAMSSILEQLSVQERGQRQHALQQAARGKSASWSTRGKSAKRARYVNKGSVASSDGKRCSKVEETITLSDGKQGKSTEVVCFS